MIYHDYEQDSKEIGWILSKRFWEKGFAEALTDRLIQKANADGKSVVIECSPEQRATRRIAEKLGFMYMGLIDGCDVYKLAYPDKRSSPEEHTAPAHGQHDHTKDGVIWKEKEPYQRGGKHDDE